MSRYPLDLLDAYSEGYENVDNRDGIYRRVLHEGRTLAYFYPRRREQWATKFVKVVWAANIEHAPLEMRERLLAHGADSGFDSNGRAFVTLYTNREQSRLSVREMLAWAAANPVDRARPNRPRGLHPHGEPGAHARKDRITPLDQRRIGIEVEFFGLPRRTAESVLQRVVANARYHGWRIVADGSVRRWQGNMGLELVTGPIGGDPAVEGHMSFSDGMENLALVVRELRRAGARVDSTCGVHVHVEIKDIKAQGLKRILRYYTANQDHFDLLVPQSRRGTTGYARRYSSEALNRIVTGRIPQEGQGHNRYYVVNPCSLAKFGTVEYRQMSGTLDITKITEWMLLCLAITDKCARMKKSDPALDTKRSSVAKVLEHLGCPESTRDYFFDRAMDLGAGHREVYGQRETESQTATVMVGNETNLNASRVEMRVEVDDGQLQAALTNAERDIRVLVYGGRRAESIASGTMKTQLYVAYGANLNIVGMSARCPYATPVGAGVLRDHRLLFRGVADIAPEPGAAVPVAVWKITPRCLAALDRFEGYPSLYRREDVAIELRGDGSTVTGLVYKMNRGRESAPYGQYVNTIREGYRSWGLDQTVLLDAVNDAEVADREHERHLAEYHKSTLGLCVCVRPGVTEATRRLYQMECGCAEVQ